MKATDILDEFKKSGKNHIFITGSRSMGKSTLCKELSLILNANSLITKAIYEDAITPEYVQLQADNKTAIFAKRNKQSSKYIVNQEIFKKVTCSFLNHNKNDWISIDEIGYLEKDINEYDALLKEKLHQNHFILVLRKDKKTDLLEYLQEYEDAYVIDLDGQAFDISCIIMASGASTRFGSNKLLASFHGKALIEHILDQIPFDLFKEVILVTRYVEVEELVNGYPLTCVLHDLPRQSDTIQIGMKHITNTIGCMFITCDQPLRTIESIRKLLLTFHQHQNSMVRLGYHELLGNPVVFPSKYYKELKALEPGQKGTTVINAHTDNMIVVEANSRYELMDVDTQENFILLSNILGETK